MSNRIVSKELTMEDITKKGKKVIKNATKMIHGNATLKSDFVLICQRLCEHLQRFERTSEEKDLPLG